MPNDAKFGLVVGVGLVIAIGVMYFRKEPGSEMEAAANGADSALTAVNPAFTTSSSGQYRVAPVRPVNRNEPRSRLSESISAVAEPETPAESSASSARDTMP